MTKMKGRRFVEPKHVETQVFDWGSIQWMSEPRVTGTKRMAAGIVTLEVGKGHGRHNHADDEEIIYIIEGEGTQMVDVAGEEQRKVTSGTMIHIPPGVYHSTFNTGDKLMRFLVVYSPPGTEALLRSHPGCRVEPPQSPDAPKP